MPAVRPRPHARSRPLATALLALALLAGTAGPAHAQEEDDDVVDARLEGYPTKVAIGGSTAFTWLLLVLLTLLTVGVMFKDSKRTHLD